MTETRLGSCRSAAPETVEPLLGDRKAEMCRDGDEPFAVALLDPRRHRLDRDAPAHRRGFRSNDECCASRSSVAARREDQARFAALVALQNLGRGDPDGAGAFAFDDLRLPVACRASAMKNKVSNRRTAWNFGTQRANGVSAANVEFEAACSRSRSAKRLVGDELASGDRSAVAASGNGVERRREPPFPRSSRGSRRPRAASTPSSSAKLPVGVVDPPARKDQRAGGEGHALRRVRPSAARAAPLGRSRTTIRVAAGIASSFTGRAPLTCR